MPRRKASRPKIKKTSPFGIFAEDPSFFSHFLIKQERGETAKHYLERYRCNCLQAGESRWDYFYSPIRARAIFFLVGLRNRWYAREVYALSLSGFGSSLKSILSLCRRVSRAIVTLKTAQRSGSFTTQRTRKSVWDWAQYRPNVPVYHLELLRYQLLTGSSYPGPFPENLPAFPPDFSDFEQFETV